MVGMPAIYDILHGSETAVSAFPVVLAGKIGNNTP